MHCIPFPTMAFLARQDGTTIVLTQPLSHIHYCICVTRQQIARAFKGKLFPGLKILSGKQAQNPGAILSQRKV